MSHSRRDYSTTDPTTNEPTPTDTNNLSSSSSASASNRNEFTLIEATREQFESGIRKLRDSANISELNNNSIASATSLVRELGEGSGALRLDMNQQKSSPIAPTTTKLSTAVAAASSITAGSGDQLNGNTNQTSSEEHQITRSTPSYSSIFTSTSYRRALSPQLQHQQTVVNESTVTSRNTRAPLRKQYANAEKSLPLTLNRMSEDKKWSAFAYDSLKSSKQQHRDTGLDEDDDDDDEVGDAGLNEKIPFSLSNMSTKQNSSSINNKRVSPESQHQKQEQRCEVANLQQQQRAQNAHTKISFNDSRPPSFNTCQGNGCNHHELDFGNRKFDWRDQPLCLKCDCSNCYKKAKISQAYHARAPEIDFAKYSKTKYMHLVLKSIILILLTLLLLMLVVSMIVASHYLPQVFDRIVNVSRSFNVTIAG